MNIELARLISLKLQLIRRGTGIYIGDNGVYLVEVARTVSGIVLSKAAHEPFPQEIDDVSTERQSQVVAEMVLKCYQAAGIKPANACSSPPPAKVVTRYFQLPMIPARERKEAIRFEGSRYVPFKLSDTVSSYYTKETADKKNLEVVFNAIPIDVLRAHVNAIENARVKLWDTEPPFYALARALRDKIGKNQEPLLIIHIMMDGSVCLCVLKNHVFYVCRDFFLSFKDQRYLEKFFFEVNSSLDYFKRQSGDPQNLRVLLAGNTDLTLWKRHLEEYFPNALPVEIVADFPTAKGLDPQSSSGLLIPIGLALKAIGVSSPVNDISLLDTGAVAEERTAARTRTGFVILAILLIGVLFYFGYYIPQLNGLKNKIASANSTISQLSQKFPDISSQPVSELEKRVANIEEKTRLIEAFQKSRSFINEKLLVLARTIPQSIWFANLSYHQNMKELSISKRELILDGYVYYRDIPEEELRQINEFVDFLKKDPTFMSGFNSVELSGVERANYASHGFTKFHILCIAKNASTPDSAQG